MDSTAPTPFIQFLNQFVLPVLFTLFTTVAAKVILQWLLTEIGILKRKIKPEDWAFIENIVTRAVQYAEQTGMTAEVKKVGEEKFAEALANMTAGAHVDASA
jgi:Bacteriophage holin of superfamily 6 (Holin_LLH)